MALPTLITVSGLMLDIDGTPSKGHVAFYSSTQVLNSADESVIVPSYKLVPFEVDGSFEIELPASNDPAWTPVGWTYKVVVNYNGNKYTFDTVLPYDANDGLIDFSDLLPALEGGSELYAAFSHTHSGGGGGGSTAWGDITGKPSTFPPSAHTHDDRYFTESEVTTLLSGKENTGVAASALASHESDTTSVHGIADTSVLATNSSVSSAVASAISAIDYPVDSVAGKTGTVTLVKGDVGLGSVDNTSDASKPVSTATQTALDAKAPLASPAFTGTPTGITKTHVGLGNVDNTTDASKPVSTATQTALNLKANLASPTFTGTVAGISKSMVGLANADNTADTAKPVSTAQQTALDIKPNVYYWNGSAYAIVNTADVYVGPNDPGSVGDGSVWIDTTP